MLSVQEFLYYPTLGKLIIIINTKIKKICKFNYIAATFIDATPHHTIHVMELNYYVR